jgi:hypothetical protein
MTYSMSRPSLSSFDVALNGLTGVLEKGEAFAHTKKCDPSVLLQTRLAPDMFPLVSQVRIACDLAKNGMGRLAGIDPPYFEDAETTFAQLKDRISRTRAFLKTLDASKIDASGERQIVFPLGPVKRGEMKGDDYLAYFVIPNFYFHLSIAYAILRSNGLDIGKTDYLGAIPVKMTDNPAS